MISTRRSVLLSGASAALLPLLTGKARAGTDVVSIGYQKYGTLVLLKEKKFLEQTLAPQGVTVRWAQFPAGPPMLQAMMAGALDFGQTGDLPPVFAEASKPGELICTGHEPASGSSEAIIVPAESSILTVNDLAGKRVAVTRWSDAHWLLLAALRKHGMSFHDIRAVYLLPTAARPAFENATVDAWAIWDPYFSAAGDRARSIVTGNDVGTGMEFYMARRQFAEGSPALMEAIRTAVTQCDAWAQANRPEVVGLLSASTGLPPDTVARSIAKISFGLQPMTPDIVSRQRETADIFRKEGLLPS